MLCSKPSISVDPRLRQPTEAPLLRGLPRLVLNKRCTTGRRGAAAEVVLQPAVTTAVGCHSITQPTTACYAASGSTLDTPDVDTSSSTTDNETVLQGLLAWLVANGVTGVGQADSEVALYQDTDGDRGIVAVEDIPAGVELIRVPLRLAITDVMNDQQRSQLVGQGALWQDRLVAKLLHEVQLGKKSAWYPYIRALPRSVPSALESFSASEALEVQLPAAVAAIQGHADKMSASWQACRPDAISGADLKTYRWAHSCVMSRTFGNAAPGGGIGVHMMVPLIDMLNHAGDETESGLLSDQPVATDNVRWGIVKPYRPNTTKPPIWEPLVLYGINPPLTVVPTISRGAKAGDPEVFWSNVKCPANADPKARVGDGAWTGTYLTDITRAGDTAVNEVNVNIVFKLDKPCGKYGTGTISVIGRAGGSDDFSPVDATIAGGTGDFSFVRGGILTVTTNPADNSPIYTFRFFYYK